MPDKRVALITGANQGIGLQVAKELSKHDIFVFVGSRNLSRGEAAVQEIGRDAAAIQLDVTDHPSIAAAAARIRNEFGRLDILVNNAAISNTGSTSDKSPEERAEQSLASVVSLDEVRAVWETNVFGALAVYQAMLPLLRNAPTANIVNVSSGAGSLTINSDPNFPYRKLYNAVYAASKTALNAVTFAMMTELESTSVQVRLASPAYTRTNLNGFAGIESVEDGSREIVRVALLGPNDPSGTFTRWENIAIPW